MKTLIPLIIIVCFAFSCTKEDANVCADKKELKLNVEQTAVSQQTIGRVLFYDTRLSENNSISCASCHKQSHGFADDAAFSTGFQGKKTGRNAIAITSSPNNIFFFTACSPIVEKPLFWDGRESNLSHMVIMPLLNHVEMGVLNSDHIVDRVNSVSYYRELFSKVYGTSEININLISECLATFVNTIANTNSKFDKVSAGHSTFSALEQEGSELFNNVYPCGSCHSTQNFYGDNTTFRNIGLDQSPVDQGRAAITGNPSDIGSFKVPSLKNVANTAPYMHDGRFNTLEDVLDHYSHGIQNDPNLDSNLKNNDGTPVQLQITDHQKRALIAFLSTFSDFNSMSDENLSDPFSH
jgi:cytochrome c peroxidase